MNNFYRVVVDEPGCSKCRHGEYWTISSGEGEDETAIGTSYGDKETAEDICSLMNMAFDAGVEINGV